MKKLLSGAIIATALALAAAPVASADYTDDAFVQVLHSQGIGHVDGDWAMIAAGHETCQQLYAGSTPMAVAVRTQIVSSLSSFQSGYFVGAAIESYCPEFTSSIIPAPVPRTPLIYAS